VVARKAVRVRDALPEDAGALVAMWRENTEAGARLPAPDVDAAARAIGRLRQDPEQRLLVACVGAEDEEVVGVAHAVRAPLSPIHEEATVHVGHLFVDVGHRRQGVAHALLAAAAAWADATQTTHLMAHVAAASRDANRFLARLGLASVATVRTSPVLALQERLARFEATDGAESQAAVERLRVLRRRQAFARAARRHPVG
jgi:GNAT superfamily N-acetyltransferase